MDFKVGLTEEALADLRDVVAYIARVNPLAARRTGERILDDEEARRILPQRGALVRGVDRVRQFFVLTP